MASFFCPYLGEDIDEARTSTEHIIPESLGGTLALSIPVDQECNNRLGTEVDGPLAEVFAYRRMKYKLKGHSGIDPKCVYDVSIPALGGLKAKWDITADRATLRLAPEVKRETLPDGSEHITVRGETVQAQQIYDGIRRKAEAKGKTVTTSEQVPTVVENPQVTGQVPMDLLALARFWAKAALGIGHFLWGKDWSAGPDAQVLRRLLWRQALDEANAVGLQVASIKLETLGIRVEEFEHAFLLSPLPGGGCALAISLFGQEGMMIRLGAAGGSTKLEITAVILNVQTGALRHATLLDLLKEGRLKMSA